MCSFLIAPFSINRDRLDHCREQGPPESQESWYLLPSTDSLGSLQTLPGEPPPPKHGCPYGTEGTCVTHMLGHAVMARVLLSPSVTSHSSQHHVLRTDQPQRGRQPRLPSVCWEEKEQSRGLTLQRTPHLPPQRGQSRPPCTQPHPLPTHLKCYQLEIHSVIFKFSFFPNVFFRNPDNSGKPSE